MTTSYTEAKRDFYRENGKITQRLTKATLLSGAKFSNADIMEWIAKARIELGYSPNTRNSDIYEALRRDSRVRW